MTGLGPGQTGLQLVAVHSPLVHELHACSESLVVQEPQSQPRLAVSEVEVPLPLPPRP